jgi:hypothetical protein
MSLPGFNASITLVRDGQTSQDAMGTPVKTSTTLWTKRGHYQQRYNIEVQDDVGRRGEAFYQFYLPFITGTNRPAPDDKFVVHGRTFLVIGILQEALRHHLVVKARISER